MRKLLLSLAVVMLLMLIPASAEAYPVEGRGVDEIAANLDMTWVIISAALVFFMQAGFFLLEGGLTRSKNISNAVMKGAMDFCLGAVSYWAIGFGIMFGASKLGIAGTGSHFLNISNPLGADGGNVYAFLLFQIAFAGAAATILAGGIAERFKFSAYIIATIAVTAFIYPFVGHWIWGEGGWLSELGMFDFAGSTVVHTVGGVCAFAGAFFVGSRSGKYNSDGSPNAIPGHNIPMAALGTFILWLGWFGFNAGSTLEAIPAVATIALNTTLAGSAGGIVATLTTRLKYGKPDVSMSMNGILAGLVSITAGCAVVSPVSSFIIGAAAGIIVVFSVEFIDRVLKVDDPVGAVSVHAVCGIWGTLAVGIFAQSAFSQASVSHSMDGLLFGGGFNQLGLQALGVAATVVWTLATASVLFLVLKRTIGIRADEESELAGLDLSEHNVSAYPDFLISCE